MAGADQGSSGRAAPSDRAVAVEQGEGGGCAVRCDPFGRPRQHLRSVSQGNQKSGKRPELFVQINTGEESQKAGVAPQDADTFIAACREKYDLPISGLMCIPPVDQAPAPHFALCAKIAARNGLKNLSMGMSADFPVAIAMGATHVRVGSAIFGTRTKPHN